MVAIKIQSLEDIIGAFLENLGFNGSEKQKTVEFLVQDYNNAGKPDLSLFMQRMLRRKAGKIFKMSDWDDSQKAALFRYIFLNKQLAKKYGYGFFANEEPDSRLIEIMQHNILRPVPPYHYSEMPRQVIASPHPRKLLDKVLHIKRD